MSYKQSQEGSTLAVVAVAIIIALVAALGYVLYQNTTKEPVKKENDLSAIEKDATGTEPKEVVYMDFRQGGLSQTGVEVSTANDVAKLTHAGDKLAAFLRKAEFGKEVVVMGGETKKISFVIDRLQGDYAVGGDQYAAGHMLWGPENGTGEIKVVAGTQNEGFSCKELTAANVPGKLVDGKCLADDTSGLIDYSN